ncbi:MAG: hypothetical protein IT370_12615 [Deltaproteobacteria bacterium]|nr:hypothetical protein [Deltaproteobacteria bacterium]
MMRLRLCVILLTVAWAARAEARKVFLNGVEVEGLANQSFGSCEVKFDADGNVWIQAKGYAVKVGAAGAPATMTPAPAPVASMPGAAGGATTPAGGTSPAAATATAPAAADGKLRKRYWIVATQPRVGAAQYDVDVFLNGKFLRKVRSKDAQTVVEITDKLAPGRNVIHLAAQKSYTGGRRFSASPDDTFTVIVGEGAMGKGTVTITNPLARMVRSAAETRGFVSDSTITAR